MDNILASPIDHDLTHPANPAGLLATLSHDQSEGCETTDSVSRLCARLGIEDLVHTALAIVKGRLRPEKIRLEAATDPEGDSEWLVIRAEVHASVDEVLQRYSACKREWVRLAPPTKQGFIRFLYNIV